MDSDEEDYVFFGTPIEHEEEITNRRKKAAAEASGNLRSLPPWKQEVRDEEGRRRFHGAFTGGFSAGYYNTVGTKEGWAPQSFTSSLKNRAAVKQQSAFIFLDEDEKAELEGQYLGTSSQFDTFGFTAAEYVRKQADKEQKQRGYSGLDLMGNLMTLSTVKWCDRDRYDPQQSVILHVLKQNQKAPKRELGIIDVGPFN